MNKIILSIFVGTLLITTAILTVTGTLNVCKTKMEQNVVTDDSLPGVFSEKVGQMQLINAVEEWTWDYTHAVKPLSNSVVQTPLVADLNNDGIPEIIFVTHYFEPGWVKCGTLRAIHGNDGSSYFDVTDNCTHLYSIPAIGDIDNDGLPEIIVVESNATCLIAFENDGKWKWTSDKTQLYHDYAGISNPAIADLDMDGIPEIIVGDKVFDNNGGLLAVGSSGKGFYSSCVADIDLDGKPEIIAGRTVYSYLGGILNVKWENLGISDFGFSAIGNFDNDPEAEIVYYEGFYNLNYNGPSSVYMLEHDCTVKWVKVLDNSGSPPTIEDFDGDCFPDIGVSTNGDYHVIDRFGTTLWNRGKQDYTTGYVGSTVFDLNKDGVKDVIYTDEGTLWICDARDGVVQWSTPNQMQTCGEKPVVADVDNDGHAEIVVPCSYTPWIQDNHRGIRVFGDDANWTCARKIWNQHTYHITNVNDDASIPKNEINNWKLYNNYRVQLDTCNSEKPKWGQRPNDCTGILIDNHWGGNRSAADDFLCNTTGPITNITLWGSSITDWDWWTDMYFTLSIYSDKPDQDGSGPLYSMPDKMLWTKNFNKGDYTPSYFCKCLDGFWYEPYGGYFEPHYSYEIYQFDFDIDPCDAFIQNGTEKDPVVYWLAVEARMGTYGGFCWETSRDHWNDDAVYKDDIVTSWLELRYPSGHPNASESIDMAFRIASTTGNMSKSPNPPIIIGPTNGKIGTSYTYSTSTTDPNGDQILYKFDWGDETTSGWIGPYISGQTVTASHTWSTQGSYIIKVKAKDENGYMSEWSDPLPISMPRNKPYINTPFLQFLEQYPILYQLLQRFLRL